MNAMLLRECRAAASVIHDEVGQFATRVRLFNAEVVRLRAALVQARQDRLGQLKRSITLSEMIGRHRSREEMDSPSQVAVPGPFRPTWLGLETVEAEDRSPNSGTIYPPQD